MTRIDPEKLADLQAFVTLVKSDPSLLHEENLAFFREYLVSLGATIPSPPVAEEESDIEPFDDEALRDEEVIEPETSEPPPLCPEIEADSTEESDISDMLAQYKGEAATFIEEGKLDSALECYTKALLLGNPTALMYTRRAEVLLKLKRPVAAIRDCDEAIKLNPDNAKAYQIRGKSHRKLGNWKEAHRDLDIGQKLDYNDELWETQKLVDEKYKKIEEYERMVERKREAKAKKEKERLARERRDAAQRAYEEQKKRESESAYGMPGGFQGFPGGGMPGGFPGGGMPGGFPAGGMPGGFPGGGMPGGFPGGGMPGGFPGGGMPGGFPGGGMPGGFPSGGMPGGFPSGGSMPSGAGLEGLLGGLQDPELKQIFSNPKMMAAFQEIMSNPSAMSKYQNDPEIMAAINKMTSKFGAAMPGGGM